MQLPYFYEPEITGRPRSFNLGEDTSRHCIQVLRMQTGQQILLTNGDGLLSIATITDANKKHAAVTLSDFRQEKKPHPETTIAMALLKNNNRYEWFLEKATELGIGRIIPLLTHYTEKQHFRLERMKNILVSAMLQSRQSFLPILEAPTEFQKAIDVATEPLKYIAHCEEREKLPLAQQSISGNAILFIGPEGDFSTSEIDYALQKHYIPVSLGTTRLRTETAGVVGATLLVMNRKD